MCCLSSEKENTTMWGLRTSLHLAVHVFVGDLVTLTVGFSCQEFFTKICLAVVSSMNIGTVKPILYLHA